MASNDRIINGGDEGVETVRGRSRLPKNLTRTFNNNTANAISLPPPKNNMPTHLSTSQDDHATMSTPDPNKTNEPAPEKSLPPPEDEDEVVFQPRGQAKQPERRIPSEASTLGSLRTASEASTTILPENLPQQSATTSQALVLSDQNLGVNGQAEAEIWQEDTEGKISLRKRARAEREAKERERKENLEKWFGEGAK